MAKYLTQEWLDMQKELGADIPPRPGASVRLQTNITGGPDGDIHYYWVIEDGKMVEAELGDLADADVTVTQSYADAEKMAKGELDAAAAFMQGKIKPTGNMAKMMALMPLQASPEFKDLQDKVLAATEF